MPTERVPSLVSETAVSLGNFSKDKLSDRSDSATVEIFRSESEPEKSSKTPNANEEVESLTRYRAHIEPDGNKFYASNGISDIPAERKSTGISKGVILNAMNFGSYDINRDGKDVKENGISKPHEMADNVAKALEAGDGTDGKAVDPLKSEEKEPMTFKRKIAFGVSFLPSVMFVLAFAVILPCEEYKLTNLCVTSTWSQIFNQTEITVQLSLPESLLIGYQFSNTSELSNGLMSMDLAKGKKLWKIPLNSSPKGLKCGDFDVNQDGVKDCLVTTNNSNVYAFNASNGYVFWTRNSIPGQYTALILPQCMDAQFADPQITNGTAQMAIVSYSNKNYLTIDVINENDGSNVYSKQVRLGDKCSTIKVDSWKLDKGVDLIIFCKNDQGLGYIGLVEQSKWCPPAKNDPIEPSWIKQSFTDKEIGETYLLTNEGLLLWIGTQITYLDTDGTTVKWQDTTPYIPQNKMAKFGRFYLGGNQIALIGQNSSYNVVVSILTSDGGIEIATFTVPGRMTQAIVIQGNETDALLLTVSKVNIVETEQMSESEVVLVSNSTSSKNSLRTDAPYKVNGKRSIVEELVLFQFADKNTTHVILTSETPDSCIDGETCESQFQAKTVVSAISERKEGSIDLDIVTLKSQLTKQKTNEYQFVSTLTALNVVHADNPTIGERSCSL